MKSSIYKERAYKLLVSILMIVISSSMAKSQDIDHLIISSEEFGNEIKFEKIELKGVISLFGHHRFVVIDSKTDFNSIVRKGADPKLAKELFKNFHLKNQTIVGINNLPEQISMSDLLLRVYEDTELKQYIIYLSYLSPTHQLKENLSRPIWFIIPDSDSDFEFKFYFDKKLVL